MHIPDYYKADDESEKDPKHKRVSSIEDQTIQEEISKICSAIHLFGLKTLNYDKVVDLLVTATEERQAVREITKSGNRKRKLEVSQQAEKPSEGCQSCSRGTVKGR